MDAKASADVAPQREGLTEVIGELRILETRFKIIALPSDWGDVRNGCPGTDNGNDPRCNFDSELVLFEVAGKRCGLLADPTQPARKSASGCAPTEVLTKRELQIACLVSIGCVNKQIASELKISEWTVSSHLRRIFTKLGVRTRTALAFRCASLIHDDAPPM
jgi:DNA-binding CsgD family transcriptional regulator